MQRTHATVGIRLAVSCRHVVQLALPLVGTDYICKVVEGHGTREREI